MSIKSAREAKGLSQRQFAAMIGVQQGAVAQWEKGRTAPRFERILAIASALECPVDELLKPDSGD